MALDIELSIFCSKKKHSLQAELQISSSFRCVSLPGWSSAQLPETGWRWQPLVFSFFPHSSLMNKWGQGQKKSQYSQYSQRAASGVEPQSDVERSGGRSETQCFLPQLPRIQLLQLKVEAEWKMLAVCFPEWNQTQTESWGQRSPCLLDHTW